MAWKEVEIPSQQVVGFCNLLYFAEVVIHSGKSDGTLSLKFMSLNNFSHPRFEQSTKVFKLSCRVAREQSSEWNKLP